MILIGYFLTVTETTSADIFAERTVSQNRFQATTLSFSNRQTTNNIQIFNFFNVSGMLPGGFDIKPVRIINDGKLDFKYHIKTVKKAGDDDFCRSLIAEVTLKEGKTLFKGPLLDLSTDVTFSDNARNDWIITVSLDDNSVNLKNKNCEFDFLFNTFRNQSDENPVGLHAQRTLSNNITSGNW
ncbi:hypothetical protein HY214_00405 [Candidatus Roizmanbacteria bacterium]|nr:hypothetical protein [Candidatus Roizmanbacteria bacterium]